MSVRYESGVTLYEGQVADFEIQEDTSTTTIVVSVWTGKDVKLEVVYRSSEFYPDDRGMPEVTRDLSEEDQKAYENWKFRDGESRWKITYREMFENGFTYRDFLELEGAFKNHSKRRDIFGRICYLLEQKTIKSAFRRSIREQVVNWLRHPESRKYRNPLSDRQAECLLPPWER